MRRRLPILALLLAACGAAPPAPAATPTAPPASAAPAAAASVSAVVDRAYLAAALDLVRSAEREIEVAHFEFAWGDGVREIQAALGEAVRRGVRVRVILDDEPKNTARSLPHLARLGISARLDRDRRRIHAKILLADRRRVLFGSTNLSANSIHRAHETNLAIDDPATGAAFGAYVDALHDAPETHAVVPSVRGAAHEVHFDRAFEGPLLALLEGARARIDVQMYGVRLYRRDPASPSTRLLDALRAAARRGLPVRVIFERAEGDFGEKTNAFNEEAAAYLREDGVQVRFDDPAVTSHAKLVLVDAGDVSGAATVGSMNWGYGGLRQYHEVNAVVRDPVAVRDLTVYFDSLWRSAGP